MRKARSRRSPRTSSRRSRPPSARSAAASVGRRVPRLVAPGSGPLDPRASVRRGVARAAAAVPPPCSPDLGNEPGARTRGKSRRPWSIATISPSWERASRSRRTPPGSWLSDHAPQAAKGGAMARAAGWPARARRSRVPTLAPAPRGQGGTPMRSARSRVPALAPAPRALTTARAPPHGTRWRTRSPARSRRRRGPRRRSAGRAGWALQGDPVNRITLPPLVRGRSTALAIPPKRIVLRDGGNRPCRPAPPRAARRRGRSGRRRARADPAPLGRSGRAGRSKRRRMESISASIGPPPGGRFVATRDPR